MNQPQDYSRRVLLGVTGLSPQVVTETLYALAVAAQQPWVPTEIHLITTAEGKQRAELALLSASPGWFRRLLSDYDLPPIAFDSSHVHVFSGADGAPLSDIRSPEDNERAADFITEKVRSITADENCALHVSIAGGRKTMGFYLGYALSLFGRPQDRLSHVLVSEPYESSFNFYYPTPYSEVIETRDNSLADTRDARVTLAEIPFVSLRQGLDQRLLDGQARFSEVVAAARMALELPELVLDLPGQCVIAGGRKIDMQPSVLALYSVFARRAIEGMPPVMAPPKEEAEHWAEWYLDEYRRIRHNEMDDVERTQKALAEGMDNSYFSEKKSLLHRALQDALGPGASPYLIDDGGTRPGRYALCLPEERIFLKE